MDVLSIIALAGLCSKEATALAGKENWTGFRYQQEVAGRFNQQVYRNRPETPGNWVEWTIHPKESQRALEIITVKGNELKKYSFDKNCKSTVITAQWPWHLQKLYKEKRTEDWGDAEWKALVESGKNGIVYFWSPRFAYSVTELPRMEKLARKWNLEYTAVVDPRATHAEVTGALSTLKKEDQIRFRKLASDKTYLRNVSPDFFMRNGYNHFPVIHVYANKKVHSRWITGIMTEGGLKTMITDFTRELQ